jgi:hypothetical protein
MSIRTASCSALLALAACAAAPDDDAWAPLRVTPLPAVLVALNRSAPGVPAREDFVYGPTAAAAVVQTLQHYEDIRRTPGIRCYEFRLTLPIGERYGAGCAGSSNRWVVELMTRAEERPGTSTFRSVAARAEARQRSPA